MRPAKKRLRGDPSQLGLFDAEVSDETAESPATALSATVAPVLTTQTVQSLRRRSQKRGTQTPNVIVTAIEHMPTYSSELIEAVDRSIAELPPNRVWFTYRQIQECFAVSRATVARRVKEGLVPGIQFHNGRVIEDGSVRRFDRLQLRWLLLAVRRRARTSAGGADSTLLVERV